MAEDPLSWDDLTLARRCAAREEAAWEELLRRAGPLAHGIMRQAFARAGLPDPEREATEAMGDLMTSLLDKDSALLRAYQPQAPLRVYVAVIARHLALNLLRRRHPTLPLDADRVKALEAGEELPATPGQLREALARLPSRERLLLRLLYWDGLSYAQAAQALGVSPQSMGPLVARAKAALREILSNPA